MNSRRPGEAIWQYWRAYARQNWKELAVVGAVSAVVTSLVTLAVTHNAAVAENATAYTNGLRDGCDANLRTYFSGYGDCLDDYGFDY